LDEWLCRIGALRIPHVTGVEMLDFTTREIGASVFIRIGSVLFVTVVAPSVSPYRSTWARGDLTQRPYSSRGVNYERAQTAFVERGSSDL
jgi:hypothetical protein